MRVSAHDDPVRLRIEASDLPGRACGPGAGFPGYGNIHVGVQRRDRPGDLLDLHPGDTRSATWVLECATVDTPAGVDVTGRYIQGRPGGRFVYLSWGVVDDADGFTMFRRAKLMLDAVRAEVMAGAVRAGELVARLRLTDAHGRPLCAQVRPRRPPGDRRRRQRHLGSRPPRQRPHRRLLPRRPPSPLVSPRMPSPRIVSLHTCWTRPAARGRKNLATKAGRPIGFRASVAARCGLG
jgi:hypothetical protein